MFVSPPKIQQTTGQPQNPNQWRTAEIILVTTSTIIAMTALINLWITESSLRGH